MMGLPVNLTTSPLDHKLYKGKLFSNVWLPPICGINVKYVTVSLQFKRIEWLKDLLHQLFFIIKFYIQNLIL